MANIWYKARLAGEKQRNLINMRAYRDSPLVIRFIEFSVIKSSGRKSALKKALQFSTIEFKRRLFE